MSPILTVARKEFRSLMTSAVAYIFLLIFVGYPALKHFFLGTSIGGGVPITFFSLKRAELFYYFYNFPVAFALLVPALSMRLWPDELKRGTVELLFSYPVNIWQVVLGKFLAGMGLVIVGLALTVTVPLVVDSYGDLDWGPVIGSYVGALALGAAFLAVGLFMGTLCREQVTAFILSFIVCGIFVTLGDVLINFVLPTSWHWLSNALSFTNRFQDLGRGVIAVKDLLFFATFSVVFLILNIAVLALRKGR